MKKVLLLLLVLSFLTTLIGCGSQAKKSAADSTEKQDNSAVSESEKDETDNSVKIDIPADKQVEKILVDGKEVEFKTEDKTAVVDKGQLSSQTDGAKITVVYDDETTDEFVQNSDGEITAETDSQTDSDTTGTDGDTSSAETDGTTSGNVAPGDDWGGIDWG